MQTASPALEKVFAGHVLQMVLLVAVQLVPGNLPAAHLVQDAHGARPEAEKVLPATQGGRVQALLVAFHA